LTLHGIGNPVIDAGGNGSCLELSSNGIIVEGFTFINSTSYNSGIDVTGVTDDFGIIQDNYISNNSVGIAIHSSSNITLVANTIRNNKFGGIKLDHATSSSILRNSIVDNAVGIDLLASTGNAIRDNLIEGNQNDGIMLSSYLSEYGPYGFSDNNTVSGNDIKDNDHGIFLAYSENNTISNNKLTNNSIGLYLKNSKNNFIVYNIFISNVQNISTTGSSGRDFGGDASVIVAMFYGFIYILAFLLNFINILFLIVSGLAMGFAAKSLLKDRSLSLVASFILGSLGSIIGYFGYSNFISSSDGIAYLVAIVFAFVTVITLSLIIWTSNKGSEER
jgi:parallel beta-helix repeat protein